MTKREFFAIHLAAIALIKAQYQRITSRKASAARMKHLGKGRRSPSFPATYGDRDTTVAWRPSWGETAGPAKHPHGQIESLKLVGRPSPEDARFSPNRGGNSNNAYAQHLLPTGKLRGLSGKEARIALTAAGKVAQAAQKSFEKAQKARNKQIQAIASKKKIRPLEQEHYYRLLDEEAQAIDTHERMIHGMGQQARADVSLPGSSRFQFEFAHDVAPELREKVESVALAFSQLLGDRLRSGTLKIKQVEDAPRFISPNIIEMRQFVHPRYIAHEFAHYFERYDRAALQASLKFLDNRVRGSKFERLIDFEPLGDYDRSEYARRGGFSNPYSGKAYYQPAKGQSERSKPRPGFPDEPPIGSEILATGFEQMYQNPALFAVQDSRFFDFIWGVMHGQDSVP